MISLHWRSWTEALRVNEDQTLVYIGGCHGRVTFLVNCPNSITYQFRTIILPKEVDIAQTTPFLLTNPDFSKTEVVKTYAHTVVAPVVDYWKHTIEVKKGAQLERMKRVRIFNPLHVLANKISVTDVEGLKILKLSQHPQIMMQIEVMKTEVIKYQTLPDSIKPHVEREDVKGNDTFEISDWWKTNCAMLPAF
jgi:hypothetical protein